MNEKSFHDAKGDLALSQFLVDQLRMRRSQDMGQEMPQEIQVEETEEQEPQEELQKEQIPQEEMTETKPEITQEEPKKEDLTSIKDILKEGIIGMQNFFSVMGDFLKSEEEREKTHNIK